MITALYVVAAAMIAAGTFAAFTGWELIPYEGGWTQVISGAVLFTGGILLAGIAVVGGRIVAALRALAEAPGPRPRAEPVVSPPISEVSSKPAPAPLVTAAASPTTTPPLGFPKRPPPKSPVPDEKTPDLAPAAPMRPVPANPDLGAGPSSDETSAPARSDAQGRRSDAEAALFAAPPAAEPVDPSEEPVAASPMRDEEPSGVSEDAPKDPAPVADEAPVSSDPIVPSPVEPAPSAEPEPEPEPAPEPEPELPVVVGTYTSGANRYTMFSDGSIEAQTPTGRYTFASIEEMKGFIESGGEDISGATGSDRA